MTRTYEHVLDDILKTVPLAVPEEDQNRFQAFSCRVWFRHAIRTLNSYGIYVQCPDVDVLEDELIKHATAAQVRRRLATEKEKANAKPATLAITPHSLPWS